MPSLDCARRRERQLKRWSGEKKEALVAGNLEELKRLSRSHKLRRPTGLSESTYSVRASFYTSPENNGSAETFISLADERVTDLKLVLKKR